MAFTVQHNVRPIKGGETVKPHQLPCNGRDGWYEWSNLGEYEDLRLRADPRTREATVIRYVYDEEADGGDGNWIPTPATLEDLPEDLILYFY